MLIKERIFKNDDGTVGYYDAVYDSSNILQTTYFPKFNRLYISFNRGGVYSYENIDIDVYEKFKNADSQGKFFLKLIKSEPERYPYRKEFTLYPDEVKNLKEVVEDFKTKKNDDIKNELNYKNLSIKNIHNNDEIVFMVGDEEIIKLSPVGFFWRGKLIENDHEIYEKFKTFVDSVLDQNTKN